MAKIVVLGLGTAGINAVNYLVEEKLKNVSFAVCSSNLSELTSSRIRDAIHLDSSPESWGDDAVHREIEVQRIMKHLPRKMDILILIAGLGGVTGSLLTQYIGKRMKDNGVLTLGMVTTPFAFEGQYVANLAMQTLEGLGKYTDSYMIFNHIQQESMHGVMKMADALEMIHGRIGTAIRGIVDIVTVPGVINIDVRDIRTVLKDSGIATMATGMATSTNRALEAITSAFEKNKYHQDLVGARYALLNITTGLHEVSMDEVTIITDYVQEHAGLEVDLIWGNCIDEYLSDELKVTVIMTGFREQVGLKEHLLAETIAVISPSLTKRDEKISLYFLEEEYSPEEIAEVISLLSDIYRGEGGDALVIKGQQVLEFNTTSLPVY